jgi:hypothetical protein
MHKGRWGEGLTAADMESACGSAASWSRASSSWSGPNRRNRSQTTHIRRARPEKFRITHPFHPLSGWEFEALACKEYSGEQRVCFLDKKGRQCEIPLSWTDLAAEDPVRLLASGKSWFRAADLVELARLVEGLRR